MLLEREAVEEEVLAAMLQDLVAEREVRLLKGALVLAKGHAVHHPHIDYIIFCLPFTMMGFAALAQIVKYQAMQVRDRYAEKKK